MVCLPASSRCGPCGSRSDHACPPGQDTPDGDYAHLERSGKKQKSKPWRELYNGITNYRMWGLAACYAYTFGVEARAPVARQLLPM